MGRQHTGVCSLVIAMVTVFVMVIARCCEGPTWTKRPAQPASSAGCTASLPPLAGPSTLSHRLPSTMLPWKTDAGSGRRIDGSVVGSVDSCTAERGHTQGHRVTSQHEMTK